MSARRAPPGRSTGAALRCCLLVFCTLLPASASGQAAPPRPALTFSLSSLSVGDLRVEDALGGTPEMPEQARFERTLRAGSAGTLGIGAEYWLSPRWGVRAQALLGSAGLEMAFDEDAAAFFETRQAGPPASSGDLGLLGADLALVYGVPDGGTVRPYLMLGAGVIRYGLEPDAGDDAGFVPDVDVTRFSGLAGAGADIPLGSGRLGLRLELAARVTETPVEGTGPVVETADLRIGPAPRADPFSDASPDGLVLLRLGIGLRYALGGRGQPVEPAVPTDPVSAPGS